MTTNQYNEIARVASMTTVKDDQIASIINAYNNITEPWVRMSICTSCPDQIWYALQAVKRAFPKLALPCAVCGRYEDECSCCPKCNAHPCVCPEGNGSETTEVPPTEPKKGRKGK